MLLRAIIYIILLLYHATASPFRDDTARNVGPGRHLATKDDLQRHVSNISDLEDVLRTAERGLSIVLAGTTFELTRMLSIKKSEVRLEGASTESTVLVCPEKDGIFNIEYRDHCLPAASELLCVTIRVPNVTIASMTFEGCKNSPAVNIKLSVMDNVPPESVVFDRVTFRQNLNEGYPSSGGAICARGQLNEDSGLPYLNVEIRNCTFRENEAAIGGAVYGEQCAFKVVHSSFVDNLAWDNGGAIYATYPGTQLEISDSYFENNIVTEEGYVRDVRREAGEPIEHDVYFEFESPENGGGAIAAISTDDIIVTRTQFLSNKGVSGGAIYAVLDATDYNGLQEKISIRVTDCDFRENEARVVDSEPNNWDSRLGGAIYVASATSKLKIFRLSNTVFRDNRAQSSGGALHMVTVFQNDIQIDGCTFEGNEAGQAGGAALLRNSGNIVARNATWSKNKADLGGAILLTNGAQFKAKPAEGSSEDGSSEQQNLFDTNSAVDGGGLMCAGCGVMELRKATFKKNRASRDGGGLFVLDSNDIVNIQECRFEGNSARHGGGAAFRATANVIFKSSEASRLTVFVNNVAVSGGGLLVEGSRQKKNSFELITCLFSENRAVGFDGFGDHSSTKGASLPRRRQTLSTSLSDVTENAAGDADVEEASAVRDCGDGGGGGACFVFDRVPTRAKAAVKTRNLKFEDNHALVGGGMFVSIAGNWSTGKNSSCQSKTFDIEPCRLFRLLGTTFARNKATFGAGGLFATEPELVIVGCGTNAEKWSLSQAQMDSTPLKDCFLFEDNTVLECGGIYGPNMASSVDSLLIVDPPSGKITDHKGGDRLMPPCKNTTDCKEHREDGIKIEVRDAFNQTITGGIPDAGLVVLALSSDILGEQTYRAKNGTINVNQTKGVGVNQTSVIEFRYQKSDGKLLSAKLDFTTRECLPGEVKMETSCAPCPDDQYAFDPSSICLDCEKHAKCPGGSVLVPEDGHWHSTPYSPQFHECFIQGACVYENRGETLAKYHKNLTRVLEDLEELNAYVAKEGTHPVYDDYRQCADGYTGILCGACDAGYGRMDDGKCRRCLGNTRFAVTSLLSFLLTIFLMGIQISTTSALVSENVTAVAAITRNSKGRLRSGMSFRMTDVFRNDRREIQPPSQLDPGPSSSVQTSTEDLTQRLTEETPRLRRSSTNAEILVDLRRSLTDTGARARLRRTVTLAVANRWGLLKNIWMRKPSTKEREPLVTDYVIAREKLSETMKIFVNYLQVTSAASSISVSWFPPVRYILSVQNSLVSASNGLFYEPLECAFKNDSVSASQAIHVFWYRTVLHLASLPVLFAIESMMTYYKERKQRATSSSLLTTDDENIDSDASQGDSEDNGDRAVQRRQKKKARDDSTANIVVIFLVFIFQAYSTITGTFMEAVNCIRVDEDLGDEQDSGRDHPYAHYAIERVSRVWTQNPTLYCFQDDHWATGVVGGAGLTCSFLLIIWIFFWINSNKDRWNDPVFAKRYGFLYNSYKKERLGPYWEGVVFLRKALIQASVVFAIRLGPNLQATAALGVLLVALAVHWIERPFEENEDHPNVPEYCGQFLENLKFIVPGIVSWGWRYLLGALSLNGLEAASMLVSISVFYTGIVSYDPNASETAKDVVATATFFLNLLYVLYMLHRLYAGTHLMLDMSITFFEGQANDLSDRGNTASFDPEKAKGLGPVALVRKALWLHAYSSSCLKRMNEREDEMHAYFSRGNLMPSGSAN